MSVGNAATVLSDECIIAKRLDGGGYGRVYIGGKPYRASRVVYCEHHGVLLESIKGLVVMHICDNPPCINPKHLLIGTIADNNRDCKEKNRVNRWSNGRMAGEKNHNSKLTESDVIKIRERYKKGSPNDGAIPISLEYKVRRETILKIINRITWK